MHVTMTKCSSVVCLVAAMMCFAASSTADQGVRRVLTLAPSDTNPRNSEGDFLRLADGSILFVYTHYTDGADDASSAHLACRISKDGGLTWTTEDTTVLEREGRQNVMSVSLLRLKDGTIAMCYLRKNGPDDCRLYLRVSTDEATTWSEPVLCIPDAGYFVVNNDRVVQLGSGRLVIPAACHTLSTPTFTSRGAAVCYLSDDAGRTWWRGKTVLEAPASSASGFQEPGIVELKDGRLMMLSRTDMGCLYRSYSSDGGETWSPGEPTDLLSPLSPATIERIPSTGDLLLVWNDHKGISPDLSNKRTPLAASLSRDEGLTWGPSRIIEDAPHGWFCYTAMEFVDHGVLLGYCAGDRRENNGLGQTQITLVSLPWLYGEE